MAEKCFVIFVNSVVLFLLANGLSTPYGQSLIETHSNFLDCVITVVFYNVLKFAFLTTIKYGTKIKRKHYG